MLSCSQNVWWQQICFIECASLVHMSCAVCGGVHSSNQSAGNSRSSECCLHWEWVQVLLGGCRFNTSSSSWWRREQGSWSSCSRAQFANCWSALGEREWWCCDCAQEQDWACTWAWGEQYAIMWLLPDVFLHDTSLTNQDAKTSLNVAAYGLWVNIFPTNLQLIYYYWHFFIIHVSGVLANHEWVFVLFLGTRQKLTAYVDFLNVLSRLS